MKYLKVFENFSDMWKVVDGKLYREFKFKDFTQAIQFINKVAELSESLNHHPEIRNVYNKVEILLYTHDSGDVITDKDKQLAEKIDQVFK
jgi:4a-hydroxytetrahydrobiopterin dehydratase